jgi:hypothetical protein
VDNRSAENEEISKARVKTLVDAWNARDPENWAVGLDKGAMLHSSSTDLLALSNDHADEKADHDPSQMIPHRQRSGNAELERILTGSTMEEAKDERRPGWWRQTKVLTVRAHKNVYRNVPQLVGFAIQAIMLGVIIGLTYLDLPEVRRRDHSPLGRRRMLTLVDAYGDSESQEPLVPAHPGSLLPTAGVL